MNIMNILIAAGVMGAMGLVFGAVLSIVGQKFDVPVNPAQTRVRELLPGANCGGCGYAGCDAYAQAVAEGTAKVNLCPVGGDSVAQALGEVMGVAADAQDRKVVIVQCRGDLSRCQTHFEYDGPRDCKSAALAAQGDKACAYACLGLGDCEASCPFGAIHVGENRLAYVDEAKCRGCGLCVAKCPRDILKLMRQSHPVHRTCSAMTKGKNVRESCTAGCVSCGKCEKNCKFGALKLVDNLPEIDLSKCVGCMQCADKCPTGALSSSNVMRRRAIIDVETCVACDRCNEVCQFEAITRNEEGKHSVVAWNCVGCGVCADACPVGCIHMLLGVKRYKH